MATQPATIDEILAQTPPGSVSAKKMFGEYGLFSEGKMVAIVGEDQLFVKITPDGAALVGDCDEVPPYPGAKPCFLIPRDRWAQPNWLAELFKVTSRELPLPKKKKSS